MEGVQPVQRTQHKRCAQHLSQPLCSGLAPSLCLSPKGREDESRCPLQTLRLPFPFKGKGPGIEVVPERSTLIGRCVRRSHCSSVSGAAPHSVSLPKGERTAANRVSAYALSSSSFTARLDG